MLMQVFLLLLCIPIAIAIYTIYWLLVPNKVDYSEYTRPAFDYASLRKLIREKTIQANGVEHFVNEAGPESGKLIIFLHGFPEIATVCWSSQIVHFAKKGYLVAAPDIRGFGQSKVTNPSYCDSKLGAHDVALLITSYYKRQKAIVVAHDWGGEIALQHSYYFPEQVEKLVLLNILHTQTLRRAVKCGNFAQMRKSYYIFLFQVRRIAEWKLRQNDWSNLVTGLEPAAFSKEDIQILKASWEKTLENQLGLYRSVLRKTRYDQLEKQYTEAKERRKPDFTISHPTLFIFGKQDAFLDWRLVKDSVRDYFKQATVNYYENSTHWVQHLEPSRVNADIEAFVTS